MCSYLSWPICEKLQRRRLPMDYVIYVPRVYNTFELTYVEMNLTYAITTTSFNGINALL